MNAMKQYNAGIDVGINSVGFAAIEVDSKGLPLNILNNMVVLHDSGVDPWTAKTGATRLANSGTARRTRKLIARRRKRLQKLDRYIEVQGWPLVDFSSLPDPYTPWKIRAKLTQDRLEGEEQGRGLSIALRHMARHRGWRNPYEGVESLHSPKEASKQFKDLKDRVTKVSGVIFDEDATPAEVVCDIGLSPKQRLRSAPSAKYKEGATLADEPVGGKSKEGLLGGKLMQSDNANELRKIGIVQGLSNEKVNEIIDQVFASESPKGQAGKRAKKDELPGQEQYVRALRAHLAFQRFRIVAAVANLRILEAEPKHERLLSQSEKDKVIEFLMSADGDDGVTWSDVAEELGIERECLSGTAKRGADGERPSSFPPTNSTNISIVRSKVKPLIEWWRKASDDEQAALVTALSNADELTDDQPSAETVRQFLSSLDEQSQEKIDKISLPKGRAAYSVNSLERLTRRMLKDSVDLFEARKREFGVDNNWTPTPDSIGEPVGNPAVDRVLKIVNRWLLAVTRKWGPPKVVNIEHVRVGFTSAAQTRKYEEENKTNRERNLAILEELRDKFGTSGKIRREDITRFAALRRQNCQCAYCGEAITFFDCEMDHIVPRKGPGSTNTRNNLVAICERCNKSKSNMPFSLWAQNCDIPGVSVEAVIDRVRTWIKDPELSPKQYNNFKKDVIERLRKTVDDDAIDNRSIESVAWMATELADRIGSHFRTAGANTKVRVYRGWLTSEARKASGFEGKINLIGGRGKTRLDRRHHAMDAATIALMRQSVAQTLVERASIRESDRLRRVVSSSWKDYRGTDRDKQFSYGSWLNSMNALAELFNRAIDADGIPVTQNLRLRLGNGEAHDATIRSLEKKRVGASWTIGEIDRASTPQLWLALTRQEDFDQNDGLPANASRELRVKNHWFHAEENVTLFPTKSAAIAVRGGYAEIGNTIHHARLYKLPGKKLTYGMIRVFAIDLLCAWHTDLFSSPLLPESISLRTAETKVRRAVEDGTAMYIGWLVDGDEIVLDPETKAFKSNKIGEYLCEFPGTKRWKVDGFPDKEKLRLRPLQLAGEGLPEDVSAGTEEILGPKGNGWRVAINALFKSSQLVVVRRTALGMVRKLSRRHLPLTTRLRG